MNDPKCGRQPACTIGRGLVWRRLILAAAMLAFAAGQAPSQTTYGEITLTWDPNTEPVAGYIVYVGTRSGRYDDAYDVGDRTTFVYSGVVGRRYYFAVSAYYPGPIEGELSREVNGVVRAGSNPIPPLPDDPDVDPNAAPDRGRIEADEPGVRAHCAGEPDCYSVRLSADGLDTVTAMSAADDGTLVVVVNGLQVYVIEPDRQVPVLALNAREGSRITDAVAHHDFARNGHIFVGVAHRASGAQAFNVIRYRWLLGSLGEAAHIIADVPVAGDGSPRLALDRAERLYIALPAEGATGRDGYAGRLLAFNADGTALSGSRAASPVLAESMARPEGIAVSGGRAWIAGGDDRWPGGLARVIVDGTAADWPRRLTSFRVDPDQAQPARIVAVSVSAAEPGKADEAHLAYIDEQRQLHLGEVATASSPRVELKEEDASLVPEAIAFAGGRLFVAARRPTGASLVVEIAVPGQ